MGNARNAIRFIWYDKAKSLGALTGIVISTFLIGQQAGVFIFLTSAMKVLINLNPEYVWVVDNKTSNANALGRIDMRNQYQLESLAGVARAYPLLLASASVQRPDGDNSPIVLVGVQAPAFVGAPPAEMVTDGAMIDLVNEGAVCIDYFDDRVFRETRPGTRFEINGRQAHVAVRTYGVRPFAANALVFTTLERARALSGTPYNEANAFLVAVEDGADPDSVTALINRSLFGVRAWRGEALARSTVNTVLRTTSIGFSIGSLVLFAFIAGFFIVGLTLYSAAVDRLRDFGTMKAIGATNGSIRRQIYTQAMIFAVAGFAIGWILTIAFKHALAKSGLLFEFSTGFSIGLFVSICLIAIGGAAFAARRIARVEPAEVFRF